MPQLSGSRLGSSIQCNVPLLYRQCLRCSIEQITMLIDIVSINEFFLVDPGWMFSRYSHCQRFSFHQRSKRLLSALSLLLTFNDSCVLVNVGVPSAKMMGTKRKHEFTGDLVHRRHANIKGIQWILVAITSLDY